MAVTSSNKWSCPTCTYNNWQSWSQCVLCGSSKPIDQVIPRTPVAKYRQQNSGWSKLGPSSVTTSSPTGTKGSEVTTLDTPHGNMAQQAKVSSRCKTKGKWTCSNCTYLNWPNKGQCSMCGQARTKAPRNEVSRAASRTSESILLYASGVGAVGGATGNIGGACDIPLHTGKVKGGRQNSRGQSGASVENKKWKCQRCTYENWPRALKCTMCQGPKNRTPSPPLSGGEESSSSSSVLAAPSPMSPRSSPQIPALSLQLNSLAVTASSSPSPAVSRAHPNDPCNEVESTGTSSYDNKTSHKQLLQQPGKEESGSSRDRRISAERHHPNSRQIQIKSDSDEVKSGLCECAVINATSLYVQLCRLDR